MSQNYDAIFSGYEVLSELGYANAKVMKARIRPEHRKAGDPELVALKILPSAGRKDLTRFEQEAAILVSLDHPHVVKVVEVRLANALFPFMALEYIAGGDVRQLLDKQKTFSVEEVCRLAQQLCSAFGAIHRRGITHRDVKPENVLVRQAPPSGDYVLTDFGIALMEGNERLSSTGESPKTLVYASPEQCADELRPITPASDYYSLGVILYEALTGLLPYYDGQKQALTTGALRQVSTTFLIHSVNTGAVPPFPPELGVPSWLQETVLGLLAKTPEKRGLASLSDWAETARALEARFEQGSWLWQAEQAQKEGDENRGRGYLARIISHAQPDALLYPQALALLQKPKPPESPKPRPTPDHKTANFGGVMVVVSFIMVLVILVVYNQSSQNDATPEYLYDSTAMMAEDTIAVDSMEVDTIYAEPSEPVSYTSSLAGRMVYVGGGSFTMGSKTGGQDDAQPEHRVELDGFYMGQTEVTVGQYLAFCKATNTHWPVWLEAGNAYHVEKGSDSYYKDKGYARNSVNLPIVGVSYLDALGYCAWLSTQEPGRTYDLPTEAQWEYAAGGGPQQASYTYAGGNDAKAVGWTDANSGGKPHAVKGLLATTLGLYDMSGNVWEWCKDWYAGDWYSQPASRAKNPENKSYGSKSFRVLRGGSWFHYPTRARVAFRHYYDPLFRPHFVGFRVVASLSN